MKGETNMKEYTEPTVEVITFDLADRTSFGLGGDNEIGFIASGAGSGNSMTVDLC